MATKKSKLVIAIILLLTMVSFFSLPVSVFADTEPNYNLWIASDDYATVYIDSASLGVNGWADVTKLEVTVADDPFIAVSASDTDGTANIAGFKLVLERNNSSYLSTNSEWYYYTGMGIPPTINELNWYQRDYQATDGWEIVTSISNVDQYWAKDADFPDLAATWIWSPNYKYAGEPIKMIDTPVYLRSMIYNPEPTTPERQHHSIIHGDITPPVVEVPVVVVTEEPTPAGPVIIPVIDEPLPAAPAELPKTGGLDPSFLYGLGTLLAGSGLVIKRRKAK